MDLKSGYWQTVVDERDREKTAFVTPDELDELKVMPLGLCLARQSLKRVMDTLPAGLKYQSRHLYLDDVVVVASDFDEHLRRPRTVLQDIQTTGRTLIPSKCLFACDKRKILGDMVSNKGVCPDPEKTRTSATFSPYKDRN